MIKIYMNSTGGRHTALHVEKGGVVETGEVVRAVVRAVVESNRGSRLIICLMEESEGKVASRMPR